MLFVLEIMFVTVCPYKYIDNACFVQIMMSTSRQDQVSVDRMKERGMEEGAVEALRSEERGVEERGG